MNTLELLTTLLVLITGVYAYLTYRLAKASESTVTEMREQSEATSRPYVVFSMPKIANNPFTFLQVENTGKTPAMNLKLSLGPEFDKISNLPSMQRLKGSHLFTRTSDSFPPNSPVLFHLGIGSTLGGENEKKYPQDKFSITAEYSFGAHTVKETTWIDVNQFHDSMLFTDPIVDALKKIEEELRRK